MFVRLRIRQCSIQFYGCTDLISRVPIALNICKYFSAFPPIWLTAAASLGYSIPNMPTVIAVSATVNSLYSFAWDVVMDWGFISFSRECKVLVRQRLLLPFPTYFIALALNLLLRFSWTVNRFPGFSKVRKYSLPSLSNSRVTSTVYIYCVVLCCIAALFRHRTDHRARRSVPEGDVEHLPDRVGGVGQTREDD